MSWQKRLDASFSDRLLEGTAFLLSRLAVVALLEEAHH